MSKPVKFFVSNRFPSLFFEKSFLRVYFNYYMYENNDEYTSFGSILGFWETAHLPLP